MWLFKFIREKFLSWLFSKEDRKLLFQYKERKDKNTDPDRKTLLNKSPLKRLMYSLIGGFGISHIRGSAYDNLQNITPSDTFLSTPKSLESFFHSKWEP